MDEPNYCPSCGVTGRKLTQFGEDMFYCRSCEVFSTIAPLKLLCPQCNSKHLRHSDYPSVDGSHLFHCMRCGKLAKASEVLAHHQNNKKSYVFD